MCNFPVNKYEEVIRNTFNSIIRKEPLYIEIKYRIACTVNMIINEINKLQINLDN